MVQYIFTPWRDRRELLMVRRQFYPDEVAALPSPSSSSSASSSRRRHQQQSRAAARDQDDRSGADAAATSEKSRADAQRRAAVARVSMWMQRGNCPHMVESTALLAAAILGDEAAGGDAAAAYAVRASYCAAFSRFVTGLLDGHQDKQRKLSMYSVAKAIGLPATYVELRHQATHEQLPSLVRLRPAARGALAWIWGYYWRQLGEGGEEDDGGEGEEGVGATGSAGRCKALLVEYLAVEEEGNDGGRRREKLWRQVRRWDDAQLLRALAEIGDATADHGLMIRSLKLSREIVGRQQQLEREEQEEQEEQREAQDEAAPMSDLDRIKAELEQSRRELRALEDPDVDVDMRDEETDDEDEDEVDIKASGDGDQAMADDGEEKPPPGPALWTRYQGTWKPKPIGVV